MSARTLFLALGANLPGRWGPPAEALRRASRELMQAGVRSLRSSRIYATIPIGPGRQPPYLNAVLMVEAHAAPARLLRLLKMIERRAGRRFGPRWAPRCLDIDMLDYGGRRVGRPSLRRQHGRLILPHPEMHRRAFVLVPLLEIAPEWRHPVLGVSGNALLARLPGKNRRSIWPALDFVGGACDKHAA